MNLVETIKRKLEGDAVEPLANLADITPEITLKSLDAIVPSLWSAVAHTASQESGDSRVASMVEQADAEIGTNYGARLREQGESIRETGSTLLPLVLGPAMWAGLRAALARFTKLDDVAVERLSGALLPLMLGELKLKKQANSLDARGLASLLAHQHAAVNAALPDGLEAELATVPGIGSGVEAALLEASPGGSTSDLFWWLPVLVMIVILILMLVVLFREPARHRPDNTEQPPLQPIASPTTIP